MEHLGDPGGVLVVDETGFLKQGQKSVGVKRQYSGTAGKVENCQIGVFLAYGSRRGAAFLDRELYLPQEWAADWVRRQEAGVPEGVAFRTKAQLAQEMIGRAVAAGVPFAWVTGDTVYGNDRRLRRWLEEQGLYVLAVKNNEPLPHGAWLGAVWQGPRLYDWGWLPIRPWSEPGRGHWLLVRRSIADPEDLAYACFGTGDVSLAELARVRHSVDHRRLQGGQAGGGAGRVPSAPRLVPAHHPGDAGPCLSGGNPVLRRRWRW